jgi:hypothetical protein
VMIFSRLLSEIIWGSFSRTPCAALCDAIASLIRYETFAFGLVVFVLASARPAAKAGIDS